MKTPWRQALRSTIVFVSLLVVVFCPGCKEKAEKLNVLIITCDALRPDHLSCCGYERNTSPNIDRLAREGALFTLAVCQATWTVPSLFSTITATYPHRHRMTHWEPTPLDPSIPSLVQILRKEGYRTGFISGHGAIPAFEVLRFHTFINTSGKADTITQVSREWLRERPGKPFFLWIHYIEPHTPYGSPPPYDEMFLHDEFSNRYEEIADWLIPPRTLLKDTSVTDPDYYIAQYDGGIRFVDAHIGKLLEYLTSSGLDDNTLIIVSADHGESLGEKGRYFFHGGFPYEAVTRVPLIIWCKGLIPENRTVHTQVQLVDLMPTIVDLLGFKPPLGIQGVSLLPLILKKEKYPSPYAFSEWCAMGMWGAVGIRTEEWKLIYAYSGFTKELWSSMKRLAPETYAWLMALTDKQNFQDVDLEGPQFLLYNLQADPGESHNLAASEKDVLADLKAELESLLGRKLIEGGINEHLRERLRSLGYTQ